MIKVLKAGFYTTIQDKGRVGFAKIGVPFSGVMDTYSADIANSILNNNLEDAVLEISFSNCEFKFLVATNICISGANFSPKINGNTIKLNQKIKINKNDVLSFGKVLFGARTYVAVAKGLQSHLVLNSRSMFSGITNSSTLKNGDKIVIKNLDNQLNFSNSSIKVDKNHFMFNNLECLKGPEFYLLSENQKEQLLTTHFSLSMDINRMGFRLNEVLENNLKSIITSAVLPGTVQLTPSGKLIVLMRDCQVTGGYPRVLQLTESAINRLSQKTVNNRVHFLLKKR